MHFLSYASVYCNIYYKVVNRVGMNHNQAQVRTLYIRNLNEKVSRNTLRTSLTQYFKSHGFEVQDIKTFTNIRLRGQAFVTLRNHSECIRLMNMLNTSMLLGKPVQIQMSHSSSDYAVEQSFKAQFKNEWKSKFDEYQTKMKKIRLNKRQTFDGHKSLKRKLSAEQNGSEVSQKKHKIQSPNIANKILLLTNLSSSVAESSLYKLFEKFKGFQNLSLVKIRHVGFVEFRSEIESTECLKAIGNSLKVDGCDCKLHYAKK